jgi:N-glycosidase YbiA
VRPGAFVVVGFTGSYRFLSNFWPCCVVVDDVQYGSAEHAYQAGKAMEHCDREMIRNAVSAKEAKALGRQVKVRPDWDAVRLSWMKRVLEAKFSDRRLRSLLLSTGAARLVEDNAWGDTFWGVCKGKGTNHLGRLLEEVRDAFFWSVTES